MSNNPHGIDVSQHQTVTDWHEVIQDGYTFAYIKASEGVGFVSPALDEQLNGARGAGLMTGLYHFARPDTNPPEEEAAMFAGELKRTGADQDGNLAPCLDIEKDGGNLPQWVEGFIKALRDELNRDDMLVYASATWLQNRLDPDEWVDDDVLLWVAHYGPRPGEPGYATDRVVLHQYTSDGQVAGIDGRTDLNVCMGDLSQLTGGNGGGTKKRTKRGGLFARILGR